MQILVNFDPRSFLFDLFVITSVGFSLCQRNVLSHVSIAGIFICLLFPVKDVNIFMFYFFKEILYVAMAHFEECGHVSQSTSVDWLVNV